MKIRFEMEPGERDNIITRTEAFIYAIDNKYSSGADPNSEKYEEEKKYILADLQCAQRIISSYIDRGYEIERPVRGLYRTGEVRY